MVAEARGFEDVGTGHIQRMQSAFGARLGWTMRSLRRRPRQMSEPSATSSAAPSMLEAGLLARPKADRRAWTKWTWSSRRWTLSRIVRWSSRRAAHGLLERRLVARQLLAVAWAEAVRIP
jgi:hypothetical protein